MTYDQYLAFSIITIIFMASPGPATLLAVSNGINYGIKNSIIATLGNILAFQILIIISVIGLSAVLATSDLLFQVLKIIGSIYLIYLGIKIWFSSSLIKTDTTANNTSSFSLLKRAFLVTATSPKPLIYIGAILPQFTNGIEITFAYYLTFALTIAAIQVITFSSYAILANKIINLLKNERNNNLLNKTVSVIFMGFGIGLGLAEN